MKPGADWLGVEQIWVNLPNSMPEREEYSFMFMAYSKRTHFERCHFVFHNKRRAGNTYNLGEAEFRR